MASKEYSEIGKKDIEKYFEENNIYRGYYQFIKLYKATKCQDLLEQARSGIPLTSNQTDTLIKLVRDDTIRGINITEENSIRTGDIIWILDLLPSGKRFPTYEVGSSAELYKKGEVPAETEIIFDNRYWRRAPR